MHVLYAYISYLILSFFFTMRQYNLLKQLSNKKNYKQLSFLKHTVLLHKEYTLFINNLIKNQKLNNKEEETEMEFCSMIRIILDES